MNKIFLILFLFLSMPICFANYLEDEFAKDTLFNVKKPTINNQYDYTSVESIPIKMTFVKNLGIENDVYEGQEVELKVLKNVVWKENIIAKKDSIATAKISIIISTGMNGIPASVILEDFKIGNIDSKKLSNSFELFGQDRSLWVFPLKWALTFLPPTGSLTNFIMGGHVKLKPKRVITVYYHPEWK